MGALDQGDPFIKPGVDRVIEGHAHHFGGVAFLTLIDLPHQHIEGVGIAVMSGDDQDLAAPHQEGICGLEHFLQLIMEGGLVKDHIALATAQRAGL